MLTGTFGRLKPIKVLLVGDFMLDIYTSGKVERISPEAPVSILHVEKEEDRAGGAGNVALNLLSLGAQVDLLGRVGSDVQGERLKTLLSLEGMGIEGLFSDPSFKTPLKNRLISEGQQLMRVDAEERLPLEKAVEERATYYYKEKIQDVDVIALSDYGKGFLSDALLKVIIEEGQKRGIPLIVDPKGNDFSKYRGATLIKPNQMEAYIASKRGKEDPLEVVALDLLEQTKSTFLLITRSSDGMSLFQKNAKRIDFPVEKKEVKDVTGAGDTALALITFVLGNRLPIEAAIELANVASGIAVEKLGCARVSLSEIAERLLVDHVDNKLFDENHLFALKQVLKNRPLSIVCLETIHHLTIQSIHMIRNLAFKNSQGKLLLYLKEKDIDAASLALLTSLHEVDFIVLKSESLSHLCEMIPPFEVVVVQDEKLIPIERAEHLLEKVAVTSL